ncbi:MAG: NUDIX hydrolase [Simkaniaceae bacterium]
MNSKEIKKEAASGKIRTNILYQGKLISLKEDIIPSKKGCKHHESVVHPGAVVLIPVTEEGKIIFVRQYRHSALQILTELPAGTLEPDEDPFLCAQRELQEEIGKKAEELTLCGGFFTTPGFCNEYIHLFLAQRMIPSRLEAEDTEEIDSIVLSIEEAERLIFAHEIMDAKTICGIFFLQKWLHASFSSPLK